MAVLLSDVGGTNARLAIARNGVIDPDSVTRYRGDDYASFDDVVKTFLAEQDNPRLTAVCVAVAGPVSGGKARLTNRDWDFSEDQLARLTDADHCRLINDLAALGYATPHLGEQQISLLRAAPHHRVRNGQALVVGAGTGFNSCAVRHLAQGRVACCEAETGHTALPAPIHEALRARLGAQVEDFPTLEELFAGRGLARLHQRMHGLGGEMRGEDVAQAATRGDAQAEETYQLYTELFGRVLRELSLHTMPFEGIYLAGSVARSFAHRTERLERAFLAEEKMRHIPEATPIMLIRDDMAALYGCLAALG